MSQGDERVAISGPRAPVDERGADHGVGWVVRPPADRLGGVGDGPQHIGRAESLRSRSRSTTSIASAAQGSTAAISTLRSRSRRTPACRRPKPADLPFADFDPCRGRGQSRPPGEPRRRQRHHVGEHSRTLRPASRPDDRRKRGNRRLAGFRRGADRPRLLTGTVTSPSLAAQIAALQQPGGDALGPRAVLAQGHRVGFANINARPRGSKGSRRSARPFSSAAACCRSTIFRMGQDRFRKHPLRDRLGAAAGRAATVALPDPERPMTTAITGVVRVCARAGDQKRWGR